MKSQVVRPLGVRSKAVKLNNVALVRFLGKACCGHADPNSQVLAFLGSFLPEMDRQSEELATKARYLWQDTLELLAENQEVTRETLLRAWVLVGTPNKPTPPAPLLKDPEPAKMAPKDPPKVDYDRFLDDVDVDTLAPKEAKKTSDEPVTEEFDIEHDTFDTFAEVLEHYPYVKIQDHKLYGKLLVLGQISGKNKQDHLVYKGCKLDDDSFGKVGSIAEYERKGLRDATYKIRVLKLRKVHSLKFWVNVDDPSRPKGQRDLEELYRYFKVSPEGVQKLDSLAYSALKNSLIMS